MARIWAESSYTTPKSAQPSRAPPRAAGAEAYQPAFRLDDHQLFDLVRPYDPELQSIKSRRARDNRVRSDLFAFATACAFFGYINIVEQPARRSLDALSMIREWTQSGRRGFVMLAALTMASAFSASVEYIHSGDVRSLIGRPIILASWPYAYFVIIPMNKLLHGIRSIPASMVRRLMRDWGLLEWSQTGIGLTAVAYLGGLS